MGAYYFYQRTWNNERWENKEVMVQNDKFTRKFLPGSRPIELNVDAFHITPGYVMLDLPSPIYQTIDKITQSCDYIKRGCTLLIVQLPITTSHQFKEKYETFVQMLNDLPLDYMIAPVVAPRVLTPAMVRYFGMKKAPFLLFDVQGEEELDEIAWEWLAQAQCYSRIPISPLVPPHQEDSQKIYAGWKKIVQHCDMITLKDPITTKPITGQNLRGAGIYPYKGALVPGGYADFNIHLHDGCMVIDDPDEIRYHGSVPDVTIMRGKVVQVQQQLADETMTGMHMKVSIPKHFV